MCLREPREYRKRPISLVRNVLAKHGYDKRYADIVSTILSGLDELQNVKIYDINIHVDCIL